MRGAHELLVGEDAPTPEVLAKLQGQGMIAGKQNKRLRIREHGRALVLPTEVTIPGEYEAQREQRYEQTWSCSVVRRNTPLPAWSMRMISHYHILEGNKGIGTVVVNYCFGWNKQQTTMAARQIFTAPVAERDMGDEVDNFRIPDDMATMWNLETQMTHVTQGDAQLLLTELELFSGRVLLSDTHTNRPT